MDKIGIRKSEKIISKKVSGRSTFFRILVIFIVLISHLNLVKAQSPKNHPVVHIYNPSAPAPNNLPQNRWLDLKASVKLSGGVVITQADYRFDGRPWVPMIPRQFLEEKGINLSSLNLGEHKLVVRVIDEKGRPGQGVLMLNIQPPESLLPTKVAVDLEYVIRRLDRPPLPGINIFALGCVGVPGKNAIYNGDQLASAAAFAAAVSDPKKIRPRVRVNFPLERIRYKYGAANTFDKRVDFDQGLLPIRAEECSITDCLRIKSYDVLKEKAHDDVGMNDFLKTLFDLGLDVYLTIDSIPRELTSFCRAGTKTRADCLASDPGDFTPTDKAGVRWNISPPKDYVEWERLMEKLMVEHQQIKWWSIGNEPNLKAGDFWSGDDKDFFEFYKSTAHGLQKGTSKHDIMIGAYGEPYAPFLGNDAAACWIPSFLSEHVRSHKISDHRPRLDFFSFHHYSCDPKSVLHAYRQVLDTLGKFDSYDDKPVILEEFGQGPELCPGRKLRKVDGKWSKDEAGSRFQAAYLAATLIELFQYPRGPREVFYFDWDIWHPKKNDLVRFNREFVKNGSSKCPPEPQRKNCPDNEFKHITLTHVTPVHQVFQVFGQLYQTVVRAESTHPIVRVLATKSDDHRIALVLSNFNQFMHPVSITIQNLSDKTYCAEEFLVSNKNEELNPHVVFDKNASKWAGNVNAVRSLGGIKAQKTSQITATSSRKLTIEATLDPYTVILLVLTPKPGSC